MHGDVRVVSMRRCAKSRCLGGPDRIAKKLTASRTNRIVMHRHVLLVSLRCCFIHRCLDKSDWIAKSLIASRTNCIVMHRNVPVASMHRCVITCYLDNLDPIGIKTYYVFYCAAVSSSDIFGTAVFVHEKRFGEKVQYSSKAQLKLLFAIRSVFNTICPTGNHLFAIRSDLSR